MQRIDTDKDINLSQLAQEIKALHGVTPPMKARKGHYIAVLDDSLTLEQLQAVIDAHTPDPDFRPPPDPPRTPTRREQLATKDTLTAPEVQEALKLLLRGSA